MEELTVEEIIKYVVRIEQESYQFYRKASKILEGNEIKLLTDELAELKVEHVNQLKGLLNEETITLEDLTYMLNIDTSLFDRIIQTHEIPAQATTLDILSIALEREKNTQKNYEMLLTITALNVKIIRTFSLLKGIEEKHVKKIAERIKKMRLAHCQNGATSFGCGL